ncbi:MAG: hypothetical protein JRI66_12255, partial [Deltaproteobacteria bacterium]|nr:hypothetical protein [Deltaproteobacteria bacterium]
MSWFLSLLFSKVGAILAGALGVLALLLKGKWHKYQAQKAEARAKTAEAEVQIAKTDLEVERHVQEEKARVEAASGPDDLR